MERVANRAPKRAREQEEQNDGVANEQESQHPQRAGFPGRFLTRKWLLVLLAVSVAGHGVGFTYARLVARHGSIELNPEVSLGVFRFAADPAEGGHITGAEFSLSIALLRQADQRAREELRAKKLRVQQAVEELVRAAHSADFEDPLLGELKRQLQVQINVTLGMRAIADVIITDLELEWGPNETGKITETADSFPWAETPSG